MTNFDPGGLLVLLTVIPAVVAGAVSVGGAHLVAWLGHGTYETNVAVILGVMVVGWTGVAFVVSTSMLHILAVVLAMAGAFAVTRTVTAASYGWVLGVVLLFVAFVAASALGVYQGVDRTGRPLGFVSQHLFAFYYGGLLVSGAVGGAVVRVVRDRWQSTVRELVP